MTGRYAASIHTWILLGAFTPLGGCAPGEPESPDLDPVRAEVEALVRTFHAADTAMDAEAVIGMLWEDYEMLVDGRRLSFEEVAGGSREFMSGLRSFHTVWSDLQVVPLSADLAITSFIFRDSIVTAEGEVIRSRGPTTLLWERRAGEWRMRFGDADHYPLPPFSGAGPGSGTPTTGVPSVGVSTFERVQPDLFEAPGAQPNAWADFDSDGDLDLFVGFRGGPNRLYLNNDGTFVDVASEVGIAAQPTPNAETRAAAWGDFDGDGDPDLYLGYAEASRTPVRDALFRNEDGGTRFVDVSEEIGVVVAGATRQSSFVDFDGDGDLDLFVALRDQANRLFENVAGAFRDVTEEAGIGDPRRTVGAAWFDADLDGDLDVFIANQNGDEDGFFENRGDGSFVDVARALDMHQPGRAETQGSVGATIADPDNDGDPDIFVASYGPDLLWENQYPERGFVMRSAGTGLEGDHHSVGSAWGDFDNDGLEDLYVGTFLSSVAEAPDHLYRNLGDGRFETVTPAAMLERGTSHGVSWADFDQDGDLDLALANNDPEAGTHPLYRNLLPADAAARSLQVMVLDPAGRATRAGAEVRLTDTATGALLGTRMVETGGGYSSQSIKPVHFGIPPGVELVDVAVTVIAGGRRVVEHARDVDPADYTGSVLVIRQ